MPGPHENTCNYYQPNLFAESIANTLFIPSQLNVTSVMLFLRARAMICPAVRVRKREGYLKLSWRFWRVINSAIGILSSDIYSSREEQVCNNWTYKQLGTVYLFVKREQAKTRLEIHFKCIRILTDFPHRPSGNLKILKLFCKAFCYRIFKNINYLSKGFFRYNK